MIALLKRLWRDRRGNVLVLAGAALPLVLGSAGLASDTIQWTLWKRQLQRAADSGAMAGVYTIVQNNGSRTQVTTAVNRDVTVNNHVGITTTKVIGAPTSGAFAADPYAVQVSLSVQKKLGFSSLFMSAVPTISTSAIATVVPSGEYCVISLENTAVTGIYATGSTDLNLGCGMITNSTSMTAAVATGSSDVTASPIAAVGGIPASNNWGAGTVLQPFTLAQEDPFAQLYPPTVPSPCNTNGNVPNNQTKTFGTDVNSVTCVNSLNLSGTATLKGQIIVNGGGVDIGTQANVTCTECTIILTNSSTSATATIGNLKVTGSPTMNFTAPRSGPFKGVLVYQDRRAIDGTGANYDNTLTGSSTSYFEGGFYFPKQQLTFSGNTGMNSNCLQLVSRRVTFTGNSAISNSCPANTGASSFDGKKVRLVG